MDMSVSFTRLSLLTCVAALSVALVGCGDNEDNDLDSSNRGGDGVAGETSIENAFIIPAYLGSCVLQVDAPAPLTFTVTNNNELETERLLDISTPAAETVTLTGPDGGLEIAPQARVAVCQPVENINQPDAPDQPYLAVLEGLTDDVEPGKSVPVTFTFARAGELTFNVGVDACPTQVN